MPALLSEPVQFFGPAGLLPITELLLKAFPRYPRLHATGRAYLNKSTEDWDAEVNAIFGGWATNNISDAKQLITSLLQHHPILRIPEYQFPMEEYLNVFEYITISQLIDSNAFNISQRRLIEMLYTDDDFFTSDEITEEFFRHMERLDRSMSHLPKIKYLHAFFRNIGKDQVSLHIEELYHQSFLGSFWSLGQVIVDDYVCVEEIIERYALRVYMQGFFSTNIMQQKFFKEALHKIIPNVAANNDYFSQVISEFVRSGLEPLVSDDEIIQR